MKIESGAQRCIAALIELIETKVNYVVQEAIVVIKVRVPKHHIGGRINASPLNDSIYKCCRISGHFP